MRNWSFAKGQATRNDFIVINDRHGLLSPTAADVQFLCDRRAGIGGDGLLRAIKASRVPSWDGPGDIWYMDGRANNGDPADFGGNGLRVFVRYLRDAGLIASDRVQVGTRSGLRHAEILPDGRIETSMGSVRTAGVADVACGDELLCGTCAYVADNLHVVCETTHLGDLDPDETRSAGASKLNQALRNVEYVEWLGPERLRAKAWEAQIGETVSIGTGAVAAAAVNRTRLPEEPERYRCRVDVPGGSLEVRLDGDEATLVGPAMIVARGDVLLPDSEGDDE